MDAEWRALIRAVKLARELGLANPLFLGDSLAVINQANGMARRTGEAIAHFRALEALTRARAPLRIRHVKRTQNLAGIALARH